ncbi:MAG: LacI family DNA-binding transcriptional regulator [Oscillospiraceae bacterium]|nr:LacI family DNA-binding transcriptional regulator [Oscillospiraceae bacterium]
MPRKHGDVTIAQVAADADVSLATVSRVINQKGSIKSSTYQRVVDSMNKLGYSLPEETEDMIKTQSGSGPIIFNIPSLKNPFYDELVIGAKSSAARCGYHLLINKSHVNRSTLYDVIDLIHHTRAAGIITTNHVPTAILQKLMGCTNLVQCCEYNENVDLPYVTIDDAAAAADVVDYLLSLGRRRIALINGPEDYKYARCRLHGYQNALKKAGIPLDPSLTVHLPGVNYDLALSAAVQLLNTANPPDSFFACSDIHAAAVIRAAYMAGLRVPQDILVAGFDNIQFSSMLIPALTTVNQPKVQLGSMACELLIEKISNPSIPNKKIVLGTELIIRESTQLL